MTFSVPTPAPVITRVSYNVKPAEAPAAADGYADSAVAVEEPGEWDRRASVKS